jgi:hypothetical protein
VPIALSVVGADSVIARNFSPVVVPAAICLAAGYAASRLGRVAAAALCVLSLGIVLAVSTDTRYGRTDWRGAAARLESPAAERAIVVTPFMSTALWSPYLRDVTESQGDATVREIVVLGLATEGGFSAEVVRPPTGEPPPAPAGFRIVEVDRQPTYVLVRYRAPRPLSVSTDSLAGLRLSAIQPGVLVQQPAGEGG